MMPASRSDLSMRAAARRAIEVRTSFRRRDWVLGSFATTAPMLGVLASLDALVGSFPGFTGERWAIYAMVVGRLSNAMTVAVAGLIPALLAHYGLAWMKATADQMHAEMDSAVADLHIALWRLDSANHTSRR